MSSLLWSIIAFLAIALLLIFLRMFIPLFLIWWNPAKYKEYEMKQLRLKRKQEQENEQRND